MSRTERRVVEAPPDKVASPVTEKVEVWVVAPATDSVPFKVVALETVRAVVEA